MHLNAICWGTLPVSSIKSRFAQQVTRVHTGRGRHGRLGKRAGRRPGEEGAEEPPSLHSTFARVPVSILHQSECVSRERPRSAHTQMECQSHARQVGLTRASILMSDNHLTRLATCVHALTQLAPCVLIRNSFDAGSAPSLPCAIHSLPRPFHHSRFPSPPVCALLILL